ncbi:hypothetical protein Nepgr_030904 [Nepenthes gracilis]|uniref:Uncharacterized protein n=1 Tax=Nepenthes gracilis TaxID=150966 RepID=A0AAD3THG6_NEPGR|nr:hypothetical protein Nepgr_030904 [Nepenthes gracilis]
MRSLMGMLTLAVENDAAAYGLLFLLFPVDSNWMSSILLGLSRYQEFLSLALISAEVKQLAAVSGLPVRRMRKIGAASAIFSKGTAGSLLRFSSRLLASGNRVDVRDVAV